MPTISLLILTKNEEKNIRDCIESCTFADEIIVIDDNSDDTTPQIAESLGAKVITRSMSGDWGGQQTFAIEQAKSDWIFFIDADERCTPELCAEIKTVVGQGKPFGYWVKRINHFQRKLVRRGPLSPDWVCRLMPRTGSRVEGFVHPQIIHQHKNKKLKNPMLHYTYETWDQYLRKMNQYSTLAAEKYRKENKSSRPFMDIFLRPMFAFIKMYFFKLGFLDGMLGYILCKNYANYTMNKYVKLKYLPEKHH
ncbi:glycosyltransferase family 2 protein [Neisseria lisongii]|uniref:Glycosyltransferase family 2 protein n=1 Tax=Neisseria lisongii TaxID=2912188 RepID=A0AAW5AJW2_9NEIS|nr:glycosyltransferase family 2 protein [Neisseria lisongii]MCF7528774.1 glycosyltransferase family 2 protein [Neisseria lisongii]MCF7529632.1 glycosyltransferase family 2 protein [Neisseria lisongii]